MSDLFDTKLGEMEIAVFDLETTGRVPSKDAIIQMAVVRVDSGAIANEWSTLVDPGEAHRPIPEFIEGFTGIQDETLDGQPDLRSAMTGFDNFVDRRVVAGHNIKSFDLKFITRAEGNTGIDVQSDLYIDTLRIMRKLHPDLDGKSLSESGEFYGIDFDPDSLHDALADTRLNAGVLLAQIAELRESGVETFGDMLSFLTS